MKKSLLSVFLLILLLTACGGSGKSGAKNAGGDTISLHYAQYLTLVRCEGYVKAVLRNPWDTLKTLHTYLLVDSGCALPNPLPEGTVVRVPVRKALVYSSVHCSLFSELGIEDAVAGVCDRQYIALPYVQDGCNNGRIVDAGSSMSPDIERVMDLRPDAILLSPFENSGGYGRIEKLKIPIIECAEYMETSPLGRAEWIRFFGLLTGTADRADSIFAETERSYLALKARAAQMKPRKTVFSELKTSSAWYVPGGNSTMAKLFADAGGQYIFADTRQSGSVSLSFETVFDRAQHADVWLIKYNQPSDKTYTALKKDYAPYAHFDAFRNRQVYGCNTGRIAFYEETPFHPDRLLADLIDIFYPGTLKGYTPRYFFKLAE